MTHINSSLTSAIPFSRIDLRCVAVGPQINAKYSAVYSFREFFCNDYPAISHYYEKKLSLGGIPEEVLGEELGGHIYLWSRDEQEEFTRYRLAASWGSKLIDIEPEQVDIFSVEGEATLPIERDHSTRTSFPSGIDTENEQLFFFTEEDIYILDMDQVFGE